MAKAMEIMQEIKIKDISAKIKYYGSAVCSVYVISGYRWKGVSYMLI